MVANQQLLASKCIISILFPYFLLQWLIYTPSCKFIIFKLFLLWLLLWSTWFGIPYNITVFWVGELRQYIRQLVVDSMFMALWMIMFQKEFHHLISKRCRQIYLCTVILERMYSNHAPSCIHFLLQNCMQKGMVNLHYNRFHFKCYYSVITYWNSINTTWKMLHKSSTLTLCIWECLQKSLLVIAIALLLLLQVIFAITQNQVVRLQHMPLLLYLKWVTSRSDLDYYSDQW